MCISKKAIVSVTRKIPIIGKAITDKPAPVPESPSPSPQIISDPKDIPTPPPTQAQVLQEQIDQLQERVETAEAAPPPPPPPPPPSPPPGTEGGAAERDIPTEEEKAEAEPEAEPSPTENQAAILRASRRAKRKAIAGGRKKTVKTSGLGITEPSFGLKVTLGGA